MKMSKTDKFNYFHAFKSQCDYAYELAQNLKSAVEKKELGTKDLVNAMHTMENDADMVNHEIQNRIAGDFVVPLERAGASNLAHALDDVCDKIEDISLKAFMYNVQELAPRGGDMMDLMIKASDEMKAAMDAFENYRKDAAAIKKHLVNVQDCESQCDLIYIESVRKLYTNKEMDPETRRIAHAMLDAVEDAMDAFEKASEQTESVIAENM